MDVAIVLGLSALLQLTAAFLAFRLIWVTGAGRAWVCIATAVFLMAVRRSITLVELITKSLPEPPSLRAEWVALAISALMVVGIAWIGPLFLSVRGSQQALRESQRKISTLMGNLPGMAYRCRNDRHWTMEFVSEGCFALTGYHPVDLIDSKTIAYNDLIDADHQRLVWDRVQPAVADRQPFRLVYRIHTAAAEEKWVWEQGMGVYSERGDVLALEGFITDVTERRQAEEVLRNAHEELEQRVERRTAELAEANRRLKREIAEREQAQEAVRQSEQRFRSMVETTSDWIWATDLSGVYTYASPKVKDLLGYDPEEVIGKTPFDLMSPEEAQRMAPVFREIADSKKPFVRLEDTSLHKDGRRVVLESSGVPVFDAAGRFQGYRGVDRDITKPKEDEAKLKRTMAELARSNLDLQQFAYSASHDLQEPLRMLASFLHTLDRQARGRLDENSRRLIDVSLDAARRMQQLIDDLLAYARVGTRGKKFQEVDFNKLVDQVVADLQVTIQATGAEVTHERLPTVAADPTLMAQLFLNLLGNAIKFHGDRPPRVDVSAEPSGRRWVFSVRDNGIGIDPKYAEQVFEIFERLHPSDQYAGTGIGLAICKRVVQRHGGRIWCESQPGRGSTFHFTIAGQEGNLS